MPAVSTLMYYGAPLTPEDQNEDWVIDGVTRPPEQIWNFRKVAVETAITDVRDGEFQPSLDATGFEMRRSPIQVDQAALVEKSASALEQYEAETRALLQSITHADAVVFFDATVRHEDTGTSRAPAVQAPHLRVHVDQNPRSALARAVSHGGADRQFRRFQVINVWRPLLGPVRNFPLALCDYQSVNLSTDLVRTVLKFPAWLKDKENYSLKSNPDHRWYYWGSLSPDEAIIFKCHDSASRGLALVSEGTDRADLLDVAGLCPHSAFFDENGPTSGHLRTSIEMRALLFYN